MKTNHTVLIVLGILLSLTLNAQSAKNGLSSNTLDGFWMEKYNPGFVFKINGDTITMYVKKGGRLVTLESIQSDLNFVKKSYQLSNNAVYLWSATCDGCKWTETQTYHFSLIESDILIVHHNRFVNNQDSGEECYSDDGKCWIQEKTYTLKRRE